MSFIMKNQCFAISYGAYRSREFHANQNLSERLKKVQEDSKGIFPRIVLNSIDPDLRKGLEAYLVECGFKSGQYSEKETPNTFRKSDYGLVINLSPKSVESFTATLIEKMGVRLITSSDYGRDLNTNVDPSERVGLTSQEVTQAAQKEVAETIAAVKDRR